MSPCPACHIEYQSQDLASSQRFCEAIFGWQFRQFGDSMVVFGTGEKHIGGFMKGERPTSRMSPGVSYQVKSLDDAIAKAQSLGASVGDAKHPVPGVGFYASIIAPDGNEFGMVEFTEQG